MSKQKTKTTASGYDRYVNWKLFSLPLGFLILFLIMPTPGSMLDVGVEYALGDQYLETYFAKELFNRPAGGLKQWQIQVVKMMRVSVEKSAFSQSIFLKRGVNWLSKNGISSTATHLAQARSLVMAMSAAEFEGLLKQGHRYKVKDLNYNDLSPADQKKARKAGFHVRVAVGTVLFVVFCFLTEAIPLPMVAFCIGIIALLTGIEGRESVAALYWSDATWFIMGSLMFATAFVKTGVDRRISLMMFGRLKNPNVKIITLVMIAVIAPLTMFMSDHALAAMFLPIGIVLYSTATAAAGREDPELAKMLMISIAMACNLGGSLAPSGAARNIIMMNYTEQMFGLSIGFGQWLIYCVPFLVAVVPLTWLVINWRFKPAITHLGPSIAVVREEIAKEGKSWSRQQKISVLIFAIMLFCWITEKNLLLSLTGIRFGIGTLAVMGAIAYVLAGVVNWRDFQTKVDWGVVWLYAGAIIFGHLLVKTGGAYWIARTIISLTVPLGLGEGLGLLMSGNIITGVLTQLMADGPACAAVGPVTLAMTGIVHAGTTMIPFMTMSTSIASSTAYCLVIGTPPNAIVYSSGYLEPKDYLRAGAFLWFTNMGVLLLMAATYWTWLGWYGLPAY